jgi:hypothetical protein
MNGFINHSDILTGIGCRGVPPNIEYKTFFEPDAVKRDTFDNIQFPEKMDHVKWVAPRARRTHGK